MDLLLLVGGEELHIEAPSHKDTACFGHIATLRLVSQGAQVMRLREDVLVLEGLEHMFITSAS